MSHLEKEFHDAMFGIYRRAKDEANYTANIFMRMLHDHGGVDTAKRLINASQVSDGYSALWQRNRLDLTVEAVIFDTPKWQALFSKKEIERVKKRLIAYRYPNALNGQAALSGRNNSRSLIKDSSPL